MNVTEQKITQHELINLFGASMPIEAVSILETASSPDDARKKLKALVEAAMAQAPTPASAVSEALIEQIDALLDLDARKKLVPHGIGGLARELLTTCRAALASPPPASEAVEVKPLEWKQTDMPPYVSYVATIIGTYRVEHVPLGDKWVAHLNGFGQLSQVRNTEEEAKVVSQADYEQRILSALSRTTEAEG